MVRKLGLLLLLAFAGGGVVSAHTPICDCYDNGDDTITCEGGFSDGGTAVGVAMRVVDTTGRVLIEGAMSDNSDFTFAKPDVDFLVEFEGGEGHVIQIDGRDIEE
jgi:hypothetical protein